MKLAILASALALAAGSTHAATPPMVSFAPTLNKSPMDPALACFAGITVQAPKPIRISVGQIRDYTGKFSNDASEGGFKITQGGSLMVISALGKLPNVDQIERFDTTISEQENLLSRNELLRDGNTVRHLTSGMYDGSDYYIVGGITEVNYNIKSGGADLEIAGIGGGHRTFVMNVAADLRLVDTKTLKVAKTVSIQKQIVGYETKADIFSFFGDYLVDFSAGSKGQEPLQIGVRAVLEMGAMELLSSVYPTVADPNYYAEKCRPYANAGFRQ